MKKSPCLGCEKKVLGCHSDCVEYNEFKKQNDADREMIREKKRLNGLVTFSSLSYSSRRRMTDTQRQARKSRPERPSTKD